jgi:hypothetical protein
MRKCASAPRDRSRINFPVRAFDLVKNMQQFSPHDAWLPYITRSVDISSGQ